MEVKCDSVYVCTYQSVICIYWGLWMEGLLLVLTVISGDSTPERELGERQVFSVNFSSSVFSFHVISYLIVKSTQDRSATIFHSVGEWLSIVGIYEGILEDCTRYRWSTTAYRTRDSKVWRVVTSKSSCSQKSKQKLQSPSEGRFPCRFANCWSC